MIRTPAHKQRDPNMLPATVADWPLPEIDNTPKEVQSKVTKVITDWLANGSTVGPKKVVVGVNLDELASNITKEVMKSSEPLQTPIDPPGYTTLAGYVQRVQRQENSLPETVEIDTKLLETIAGCLYGKYSYLAWQVQKVLDKAR